MITDNAIQSILRGLVLVVIVAAAIVILAASARNDHFIERAMRDGISSVAGVCVLVLVVLTGTSMPTRAQPGQASSTQAASYAAYRRGSRLVKIPNGQTLNVYCLGTGAPTVVLEGGIGESAFTWWTVQDRIAKLTRVCAY